jgi:GDP/UDP-N,N'-diacetylbacillosamine 2-epimerase (hydrolysing)
MLKKIFAFTGIRSEYDLQYSISKELNSDPSIDFQFVVFGAHLSQKFGNTLENIIADGFHIADTIHTLIDEDSFYSKAKSASLLAEGVCELFRINRPDLIIVCGDREETIVASTIATYFNIPICHLFGGDKTFPDALGNVDEQIRNATTKLAHLHFVSHEEHRQRIIKMGEEPWRVLNFGSPALDKYVSIDASISQVNKYFNLEVKEKEYSVIIHHPLPNNIEETKSEITNILNVQSEKRKLTFVSYPNNDPGNNEIIKIIDDFACKNNLIRPYKNLSRNIFNAMIINAEYLIGNSSMGILECPFLEIPAINVGRRQKERLNAGNVIFTDFNASSISTAIDTIMHNQKFKDALKVGKCFYGDGFSGKKIADYLRSVEIDTRLFAKKMMY